MSGRQGWPNGYYQPGVGVQDVNGAVYAARQQKRSQQQAVLYQGQEQNANWFKDKPANKSARLDIVTHHQQGLVTGAGGGQQVQQHGTAQAGGSSVSIELMAKMKRQKEAKEQAEMQKELAEKRRREALLAVEKADEEYRRACEAERQATEAASGATGSAVNPPPPPPESEEPAQPAEPSTTEQKAASAAKPALDVSQDEILLSWLNHGDSLKQQWAIWYMHNPEEWIEYKVSHQKQTGGTAATTTNTNASTTTPAAPDAATAGAAADASKTAAAAAAQQNTYSQPNAQADTGATEAQPCAASNSAAAQSSTDAAAAAAAAAVAAAGAQHMSAAYPRPPPHGQAWPGWPGWPPGTPYGAVPYAQYPGPTPYPNYYGVPPFAGGPMMPYGQRPPQNYPYPRIPGPQGPIHPMYGGPGAPGAYPPQAGAAAPHAAGARPRPPAGAPAPKRRSHSPGATQPQPQLQASPNGGNGGGASAARNANASAGASPGPSGHAQKKSQEQKSTAAGSSRPPESQQQDAYATQPSQTAANAQSQQSQQAEHAHPHPPRQQQQQSQQPQYMQQQQQPQSQQAPQQQQQQQQSVAPRPPAAPPPQQAQPPQDSHPYQQYPPQPPQPSTQPDCRGEPQYTAQPPQHPQHSQHSHVQQHQSAPAHQTTQMHDSQQQQQRPMQQGQHGGPPSAAPPSAAAAASQWPGAHGAHGVRGVRGAPAQAAHGYPQPGDDVVSRSGGATESSQGVQASVQRAEQVSGGSQPQQYAAAAAADEQRFPQWAQQQQQSAPMPPAQAALPGSSQHGYPRQGPQNSSTHARTSGTPPGSQDASRPEQHRQGLYSSRKAPAAHGDRMQQQNHTHTHNHNQQQQQQQQQPVPGQQQQTSLPTEQHQQQPYAAQQQYARQDQQERPPTSFPTDDGPPPNPPSHSPESRSAGYSNSGPSGHYQHHTGAPLSHQQHSATARSSDSYVSHSSYEKAPHSGHNSDNNRGPPTWHPDAQPSIQPSSNSPPHPPQPPQPPSAGPSDQEPYHKPSGSNTVGSARHSTGGSQMSQDPNHMQHQGGTQYWQQPDSFNRGPDQSMPAQGHEYGMGGPPWGSREPHPHGGAPPPCGASAPSVPLYHRQGQGQIQQQQQHQQQGHVQGVPQGHDEPSGSMHMDAPNRTSPQYSPHPEPTGDNDSTFGNQSSKAAGSAAQFSAENPASQRTEGTKYQHTPANDMLMSGGGGSGGGSMWGQNPQDQNSQAPQRPVQGQLQSQAAGQAAAAAQGMTSTHQPLQAHQAHQVQAQNQNPNAASTWQQPQPPTVGPKPGYLHMQRAASSPGGVRHSGAPHAQAAPWLKVADQSQSFSQNDRSEAGDAHTHTGAGTHSQTVQPMQRGAGGGMWVSKERESLQTQPGPRKGYLASRSNSAPRNASDAGGFLRNNNASNRSQSADGRSSNAPNTHSQVASQQRANGATVDRDRVPPAGPPSQSQGLYASKNTSNQQGANDFMASGVPGLSHRGNSSDRGPAMSGAVSANTLNAGSLPASFPAPPTGGASTSASLASMQAPRPLPVCLPPSLPAFVSSAEARPGGGGAMSASLGGSSSGAAAQQLPLPRVSGASEVAVLPANIGASIGGAIIGRHHPSPPPGPPGAEQDTASTPSWLVSSEPQAELDKQQQLPQPLGTLPKVSSLPPPNPSTQYTQHPQQPPINSFQQSWKPQSQTQQPQPPQGRDTSNTAAPSNANPTASSSSLPRPMPRSGGSSATTPLPPLCSADSIGSIPPVHMSAASHSKPSPSPPQADAAAPLPPPVVTSGVNSVLPSPSSINPSPPSSARVDGSNTGLPQDPAGGAKPRPGPRYGTRGMGMAPYMQQGVRGSNSGSGSVALPSGKPAQNAAPDAAVPAGLPGPGNMQQNSNQPPGMQGMSQMPSQGNVPNIRMLSQQGDAGAVPATPPGIHTVSQPVPGILPASQPSVVNGKQGGLPVPAGSGSGAGDLMITTRIESGCSAMGAQVIQAGPQQQQKFAAGPMPGPGPRGGALPPAQSQGAVRQGGFISRRSPSASGPMVANAHPPAVQNVRAAQPVQVAQNGMQVLPAVPVGGPMSQIRPAPPCPSPRGVHMQTIALQPWAQGQVPPNEMAFFRGPAPARPQVGAVPMMRPPGYR